jgi:hypothetical protein
MGIDRFWIDLKAANKIKNVEHNLLSMNWKSVYVHNMMNSKATINIFPAAFVAQPKMDLTTYVHRFLDAKLAFFTKYGIRLVFVFDGQRNPLKLRTNTARNSSVAKAEAKISKFCKGDIAFDEKDMLKCAKDCLYVREDILYNTESWCNVNNVEYICAPL